jgi:HEAT repeat protein
MALELDEVRRRINVDEPDYGKLAATLGPEAVPLLTILVSDPSPAVASKAAYLLSIMPGPGAQEGLAIAAQSHDENVRIAAAAGLRNLEAPSTEALRSLFTDPDPGVRKVALQSAEKAGGATFRDEVEALAGSSHPW